MGKKHKLEVFWNWMIHSNHWAKLVIGLGIAILIGSLVVEAESAETSGATAMKITSNAFGQNGEIPAKYTCEGENVSPPLSWSGVPESAKSLVLINDDPDAPDPAKPLRTWVHWLLYNIPATATGLGENVSLQDLPVGALSGTNDRGTLVYHGPCPPIGRHRYFFKLYALDIVLPDLKQPKKADLLMAMEGHVIANCELIGTYQKHK